MLNPLSKPTPFSIKSFYPTCEEFSLNSHKPHFEEEHNHHDHHHDHHHGHDHTHDHRTTDKKVLKLALGITVVVMFLEFVYGFLTNSLALISDAIHMFTHSFALIISLVAIVLSSKKAPVSKTFGYYRAEVIAAFINGLTIVLSIFWIVYEAVHRFFNPEPIDIKVAFIIAIIGLVVNIIAGVILMQGDKENLNLKSAFVHMLTDALSSVAIIVGYIVIHFTQWYFIDILLAVLVALVIGKWAYGLLKSSLHTLMEGSALDIDEVKEFIEAKGVKLHDVHIWEIAQNMHCLTAHVQVGDKTDNKKLLKSLNSGLTKRFKIVHTVFQFE